MPTLGGMYDTPFSTTGLRALMSTARYNEGSRGRKDTHVEMYFAQLFGRRLCKIQKGIGSTAPTMIAYNCGWYIDPPPNWRDGPIKPLHTRQRSPRLGTKVHETHQMALAVKNT